MRNIYIIGVPRSGKSTLSKLIKKQNPVYNQISFEAIRNAFIESQSELNMGNRNSSARKNILPKHIVSFSSWNNKILSTPTLVEGSFCTIDVLSNLVDKNDLIICLGLGCRNIDQIVSGIKKNDKEDDYTKTWTDEQIKKHFYDIEINDKINYDYCLKNDINYYDTYENRNKVFEKILSDIKNK